MCLHVPSLTGQRYFHRQVRCVYLYFYASSITTPFHYLLLYSPIIRPFFWSSKSHLMTTSSRAVHGIRLRRTGGNNGTIHRYAGAVCKAFFHFALVWKVALDVCVGR
ncbi:uncharacterized protein BJ212DRAFT_1343636 [Suillus subaureus]|uniref:Uncharacterized protein n=1 Tax=Suillus subaureus TaxID=48587 RepID=A0A9P7EDW1_9AGAM|nr:uncharacterized protein BJ212DRAFT_1415374 [Suillus subaureus]XP_041194655.1 uncharacterized protein BJ212DRAFT_1343636 [Suillus subaureus]KAG1793565.1 hypothetical protein BJ212DRAFT_1415374 [Suillus subaureus]KAG1818978.1 hypothetical protein BJ212DRAFT_1343636 [Suillus subaureus]